MSRRWVGAAAMLALGGCDRTDPYVRPFMWQPTGAVQGDLAAMLADPSDLVRGRDGTSLTRHAGDAVRRLWDEVPKPFIGSGTSGGREAPAGGSDGGLGAAGDGGVGGGPAAGGGQGAADQAPGSIPGSAGGAAGGAAPGAAAAPGDAGST